MGSGGHRLMLTSWDTLLDRLEHSGADEDGDLQQLRGLCTPSGDYARLSNSDAEELNEVDHYKAFLKDVVALARLRGIISTKYLKYGGGSDVFGRYFHFVNSAGEKFAPAYAWVGFNLARPRSPFLWFIADSDAKERIHAQMAGEVDQHGHVPIPISATAGYAHVREEVVSRLKEIRDRIAVVG